MNIFNIQEVFAQKAIAYAPQFGLPGLPATTTPVNYSNVLPTIFKFIFGLGIVATVVSLIISGILYIFAGPAPSLVAKAKKRVLMSLIGLIILLLSNFIFNQINEELTMPKLKLVQISELSQAPGINLPANEVELLKLKIMLLYLLALKPGEKVSVDIEWSTSYYIEDEIIKGTLAKAAVDLNTTTNAILDCIKKDYSGCDPKIKEKLKVNFFILLMAKFFANLEKDFRKEIADVDIDKLISNISNADENNYKTFISTLDSALGIGGQDKYSFVQIVGHQILVEPGGHLKLYVAIPTSRTITGKRTGHNETGILWEEAFKETFSKNFFDSQKDKKLYKSIVYDITYLTKIEIKLPNFYFQNLTSIKDFITEVEGVSKNIEIRYPPESILLSSKFKEAFKKANQELKNEIGGREPTWLTPYNRLLIEITEAFPPGVYHKDYKHYNGEAIDVSLYKYYAGEPGGGEGSWAIGDYRERAAIFISKLAAMDDIKVILFEYSQGDKLYNCLSKLNGFNPDREFTLEDINNNNTSLSKNFCSCDSFSISEDKIYCNFLREFIYKLIDITKKSNIAEEKKIKFAHYPTTKGNPIHIEVK